MSKINCQQITISIGIINSLKEDFDRVFHNRPLGIDGVEKLIDIKKNIDKQLTELEAKVDPVTIFFKELYKEDNWAKLKKNFSENNKIDSLSINYEMFEKSFGNFSSVAQIGDRTYKKFAEKLSNDSFILQKCRDCQLGLMADGTATPAYLNSLFLNKFMRYDTVLTIDYKLPEIVRHNFAMFLDSGTINIDLAPAGTGKYLRGGQLNILKAGTVGQYATGGKINAVDVKDPYIGYQAKNCIIKIKNPIVTFMPHKAENMIAISESCQFSWADGATSGVFITKSAGLDHASHTGIDVTTLAEDFNGHSASKAARYKYDQDTGDYLFIDDAGVFVPAPEMENDFCLHLSQGLRRGLSVVSDPSRLSTDATDGIFNQIIVFKKIPEKNIGKGMHYSVVIIDDQSISPQEARRRISNKDYRQGGVILMRVPDPTVDNPKNTKLIDLEDDWLDKQN